MKAGFPPRSLVYGAFAGLVFGLALRLISLVPQARDAFAIMSLGFVFVGPMAMGAITIAIAKREDLRWYHIVIWPWVPVLAGSVLTSLLYLEGSICIVMFIPAGLVLSSVGGWIGWVFKGRVRTPVAVFSFALLPLISQVVESRVAPPIEYKEVHSSIHIHAGADSIWREIKSVRAIGRDEMADTWVHKIGFPRPLDAVVDHEGVGGVRQARFERGLIFAETIDRWEPEHELGFSIRAEAVPATALDEHVSIGGAHFDVLHGQYSLEKVGDRDVILHLRSRFRLSTHFNFYSGLWTEWVMQRLQGDILGVIQGRAEKS